MDISDAGISPAALALRAEVELLLVADASTPDTAIEALERVQRLQAHLEAVAADLLVTAAAPMPQVERFTVESPDGTDRRPPRTIVIEDAVCEEIAAVLRRTPVTASAVDAADDRIIVEYVHGPGPHAPPEPRAP